MARPKARQHRLLSYGLRVPEAAGYIGMSASRLNGLRSAGGGPKYWKIGRLIFYEVKDLDAWVKRRKFNSTADYQTAR